MRAPPASTGTKIAETLSSVHGAAAFNGRRVTRVQSAAVRKSCGTPVRIVSHDRLARSIRIAGSGRIAP